jgi:hypothetical protein
VERLAVERDHRPRRCIVRTKLAKSLLLVGIVSDRRPVMVEAA